MLKNCQEFSIGVSVYAIVVCGFVIFLLFLPKCAIIIKTLSSVRIGLGGMAVIERMLFQAAEHFFISVRRRYSMSVSYKKDTGRCLSMRHEEKGSVRKGGNQSSTRH